MRTHVREELKTIEHLDATEREHLADALAWVDSGAELFRKDKPVTPPKHLVAYFAVVDAGHILLVDHKNAQLWLPAGGHVEPGEHPRTTVLRELHEELGFTASHDISAPLMITCTMTVGLTAGHTDVSLWYVVHANRTRNSKQCARLLGHLHVTRGGSPRAPHLSLSECPGFSINLRAQGHTRRAWT